MKSKYKKIIEHIPSLKEYGHLYMYYGSPYSVECIVYGDEEDGENLIVSYECDELCRAIADCFEHDYEWLDILGDNQISVEEIFGVDVEEQELDVIASLLLYLVASLILEDKFIDSLNNGFLIRLIRRLEALD